MIEVSNRFEFLNQGLVLQLFNAIFKNNSALAELADKAKELTAVQKLWNSIIPSQLRGHAQAGSIQHKRLTVYVENGAIAAKIKMLLPSLLTQLKKQGLEITSIRVQVQVQSASESTPKPLRSLSEEAAKNIDHLAHQLEGSALGEALARLAKRTK